MHTRRQIGRALWRLTNRKAWDNREVNLLAWAVAAPQHSAVIEISSPVAASKPVLGLDESLRCAENPHSIQNPTLFVRSSRPDTP